MVRTRRSGDTEVTESPKFLSLNNERERFRFNSGNVPAEDIDSIRSPRSKGAYQEDEDYNMFGDKVTESRLRPRTGPGRAYNYLDADSSDDERNRRHKRNSFPLTGRPISIKKEELEGLGYRTDMGSDHLIDPHNIPQEKEYHLRRRSERQEIRKQSPDNRVNVRQSLRRLEMQRKDEDGAESEHGEDKDEDTDDEGEDDDETKDLSDNNNGNEFADIYSRVKRKRAKRQRLIYDAEEGNTNNNNGDESDNETQPISMRRSSRSRTKEPPIVKAYSLREHKPRTDLYKAPVEERRVKRNTTSIFEGTPTKKTNHDAYHSPAQRRKTKKRSAMNSSSSSTSSSGESSDEKSFKKRKAKSMAKARSRMRPMNLNSEPVTDIVKDRVKAGASLADVEPMNIDNNITFDSIGGLGKHIRALKEMVVFPLLYDKVFQRFNVDPPRGVLFYGPPGTGKTLVARALANECSQGDKRVAFFMRKGADCLSKWVGESERQLRLLFDQAYKYRPSIIFFDEIDGLAPVRSSRQDQIHSSIVSTLLALMDGLDSRGEIVVIGATNRIDSLDPALRRPGRFDREFLFPLPALEARKHILKIQTAEWNPQLNDHFVTELAEKCVGYCGADLKSLCTEAAMFALRRRYPQIYLSNEALELDVSSINVCAKDFFNAINNIIPTSRRSVNNPGRPLSLHVRPLLQQQLTKSLNQLSVTFPTCFMKSSSLDAAATFKQAQNQLSKEIELEEFESDEDEDAPSIFVSAASKGHKFLAKRSLDNPSSSKELGSFLNYPSFSSFKPATFRPRILLTGKAGQGQTSYIAPALIHRMEELPVHVLDLPSLYAVTAKTPEESCANVFHEARRKCPSIIYMPYINQWWDVLGDTLRTTLLTLIQDLNPTTPILLLATSEQPYSQLDLQLQFLFSDQSGEVIAMTNPSADERREFFTELLLQHSSKLPPKKKLTGQSIEVLKKTKKLHFLSYDVREPKSCFTRIKESQAIPLDCKLQSKHGMTLRSSRVFVCGRNNNQNNDVCVHSQRQWSPCSSFHRFLKQTSITCLTSQSLHCSSHHSIRAQEVYSQSCINLNFSNNQSSDRHQRYLQRLQKLNIRSSSATHSRSRSCFASGSVQMLHRKNEELGLISNCESFLPINIAHLKRERLRYNLRSQRKLRASHAASCFKFFKTKRMLEKLPKAAPLKAKELTKKEMDSLQEKEELTLMELRIFLRDVLHKLGSDRKFSIFTKPVNLEEAPDYLSVIEKPMDMSTVMTKIDCHEYPTVRSFIDDIDLICSNALEYNPDRGQMDKAIRHRACALKDTAYAIIKTELDKEFEKTCVEIEQSRKRRGVKSTSVPNFYRTKPTAVTGEASTSKSSAIPSYLETNKAPRSIPEPDGERFSRRVRGIHIEPVPSLETVERTARALNAVVSTNKENECDKHDKEGDQSVEGSTSQSNSLDIAEEAMMQDDLHLDTEGEKINDSESSSKPFTQQSQTDPQHKRKLAKCVWCRPSRRGRKKLFKNRNISAHQRFVSKRPVIETKQKVNCSASPSVNEPLKVDTSGCNESELRSPRRKSPRIASPVRSSSSISTRRQSLSPTSRQRSLPALSEPVEETRKEAVEEIVEEERDEETVLISEIKDALRKTASEETTNTDLGEEKTKDEESMKEAVAEEACVKSVLKPLAVVKSLEFDLIAADSGAGSSLEGNGDSRDSADNKLEESLIAPSSSHDFNENNKISESCSMDLEVAPETLIIPTERLTKLLDRVVFSTEGFTVESLEKMFSQLSQIIFKHRLSYNRLDMVTELEEKVNEMTKSSTRQSSFGHSSDR